MNVHEFTAKPLPGCEQCGLPPSAEIHMPDDTEELRRRAREIRDEIDQKHRELRSIYDQIEASELAGRL